MGPIDGVGSNDDNKIENYSDLFKEKGLGKNFLIYDKDKTITTSLTYPNSPDYEFESYIENIDFDKECAKDIAEGNGFIVAPNKRNIKKDLKDEDSIFSPKFGQTLADVNPFINRYKCRCGKLQGRIHAGLRCPECNTLCSYVDDNFNYFGWIKLNDKVILHPAFYKKVESFLGKGVSVQGQKRTKLENILDTVETQMPLTKKLNEQKNKDEPYFGIGMIEFEKQFDNIMDFYLKKKPNRKDYYDDIYEHREMVFTHCIPVYTTLLRPFSIEDGSMSYEPTNALYAMMNKLATKINENKTDIQREPKIKNQQLFNLQKNLMELYNELENILSGKKGDFRCLLGGRYNFSSRNVIVQNPDLRIDEVTLPIIALTILLEPNIKNILIRLHNMSPTEAHDIWYKATIKPNPKVNVIVQSIIDNYKNRGMKGIPIIINRNPTMVIL